MLVGAAHEGTISIVYDTNPTSGGLSAIFTSTSSAQCTERTVGTCDVVRCNATDASALFTNLSAGTVNITGGSPAAALVPAADGSYTSSDLPSFSAGDVVTVSATGATIPAFSTSVKFGAPVTITAPANGSPVIDHTAPLALAWTGGSSQTLVVSISESVPNLSVSITCTFDGAAGSASIPATVLSDLQPASNVGTSAGQGDFSIYSTGATTVSPGGFPILVWAGVTAYSALPTIQ